MNARHFNITCTLQAEKVLYENPSQVGVIIK